MSFLLFVFDFLVWLGWFAASVFGGAHRELQEWPNKRVCFCWVPGDETNFPFSQSHLAQYHATCRHHGFHPREMEFLDGTSYPIMGECQCLERRNGDRTLFSCLPRVDACSPVTPEGCTRVVRSSSFSVLGPQAQDETRMRQECLVIPHCRLRVRLDKRVRVLGFALYVPLTSDYRWSRLVFFLTWCHLIWHPCRL